MMFVRREEVLGAMGSANSNISSACDSDEEEHSSRRAYVKKWRSLSLLQIGNHADEALDPHSRKRFREIPSTETRSLPRKLIKVEGFDSEEEIENEKIVNQRLAQKVRKDAKFDSAEGIEKKASQRTNPSGGRQMKAKTVAKFDSVQEMEKEKIVSLPSKVKKVDKFDSAKEMKKEKMVSQRQSELKMKMVNQRQSELTPKIFSAKKKARDERHNLGLHQKVDDLALSNGKPCKFNFLKQIHSRDQVIAAEDNKPASSRKIQNSEEMGALHENDNFGRQKKRRRKVRSTSSLYACTQEVRTQAIKDEAEDDCLEDEVEDDCLETNSKGASLGYWLKKNKTVRHLKPMDNCQASCQLDLGLVKSEGYESQRGHHTSYSGAVEAEEASNCTMQVSNATAEPEADDFQLVGEDTSKSELHLKGIEDDLRGDLNEAYIYGCHQEDLGALKMTTSHSATRHAWNLTACDMQLSELASFPDHSSQTLRAFTAYGSKPGAGKEWEAADNAVQSSVEGSHDDPAPFEAWGIRGTGCSLQETTHPPCDFIETFEERTILLSREGNSHLDASNLTVSQEVITPQTNAVLDELSLEMSMSRCDLPQQRDFVLSCTFQKETVLTEVLSNKIAATTEVSGQIGLSLHCSRVREAGQLATSQNLLLNEDSIQLEKDIVSVCLSDSAVLQASSEVMSSLYQGDGCDSNALIDTAVLPTATFEVVVEEHGGVCAEVQNRLASSSQHDSLVMSSPHDIHNSSGDEIIISVERVTKCDQAHEVIYLSDDENEETSMGVQGSPQGMGIQSTQDGQVVAEVLQNVPLEALVHDHWHTDADMQNELSSKSQEGIPKSSIGDFPGSSLCIQTLHTTITATEKGAEGVIHKDDGTTVGVQGSPGQFGDQSTLNKLVAAAELPGQQLTGRSILPARCSVEVSWDEVSQYREPSSIISQHAVVLETDEASATQKSVPDEETQNKFALGRMPSSNVGNMSSTDEHVSMTTVNSQVVPEAGPENNEHDAGKPKTPQQCQETQEVGLELDPATDSWLLGSDSKKEDEVSLAEQVNSGLHRNLSGGIDGITFQERDTDSLITEPEFACPVILKEDVSSDGIAKHIPCPGTGEMDTPLEIGSLLVSTANAVDIASPLQTMETSASSLVNMHQHSEENCALFSTIEESDRTMYCEKMSGGLFCASDSLKPSVPCKFAGYSAHKVGVDNVETGKTFEVEMAGCSRKTNNGDQAAKSSKMFNEEEEDMLTTGLPSTQDSELEDGGGDTDCFFAGPSRMPHKRKAISPRSQFQLIRASCLEEGSTPNFRVKRMKQRHGGDVFERKQGSKVLTWMGSQADRDVYPNGNFLCEATEEIQGRNDRNVQQEPQSGSPIPTAKSLALPGQDSHNNSPGSETVSEELHNAANSSFSAFGSPDHNKQPALPRKLGLQQALLQCNDVSPVQCLQQTDSEAPRSGSPGTTRTSPAPGRPKGILKTCEGRCKCPRCLQLYKHTDTASVFIDSQMKFIGRIAKRLIGQLGNMHTIFEEVLTNHQTDSSSLPSPLSLKVKGVLDGALEVEGCAKKDLAKMARDSRRVCHILGRRRIIFADDAGKDLCDFRLFTPTKEL